MDGQANPIAASQLEIKNILNDAIAQHYGWKRDAKGEWIKGDQIPKAVREMRIRQHEFFKKKHLGSTDLTHTFLDQVRDGAKKFESNLPYINLPADKFFVATGLRLEQAAGASGDDVATLDFGAIGQNEIETALVDFRINDKVVFEDAPLKQTIKNTDPIPNYVRFPAMIVWEPNAALKLDVKMKTAAGDYWLHVGLVGYLLELK